MAADLTILFKPVARLLIDFRRGGVGKIGVYGMEFRLRMGEEEVEHEIGADTIEGSDFEYLHRLSRCEELAPAVEIIQIPAPFFGTVITIPRQGR